jgi:hypothetical protein
MCFVVISSIKGSWSAGSQLVRKMMADASLGLPWLLLWHSDPPPGESVFGAFIFKSVAAGIDWVLFDQSSPLGDYTSGAFGFAYFARDLMRRRGYA